MGSRSRTKGATAEREVARILRESGAFPDAERDLEQTRTGGGRDLIGTPGFVIQVKRRKRMTMGVVEAGLGEALACTGEGSLAAVAHRSDRGLWMVTMDLLDWCEMVRDGGR